MRQRLLQVPTAFEILPSDSRQLQAAGGEVLRASSEFRRLRRSLGLEAPFAAADGNPTQEAQP
jgi:hypothetical protein